MPLLVLNKRLNAACALYTSYTCKNECASYFLYMQECMCFALPMHARMNVLRISFYSIHARLQIGSIITYPNLNPNPNRDNPYNLLDSMILLGNNVRIQ